MTTYVYSHTSPPQPLGRFAYRNPRFFNGVPKDAIGAYILDDNLQSRAIRAAYVAEGLPILDWEAPDAERDRLAAEAKAARLEAAGSVVIPTDWSGLPWKTPRDGEALTMRGLAEELTGERPTNMADARDVIQAEVDRRLASHDAQV